MRRASCLRSLGKYEGAVEDAEAAKNLDPASKELTELLAQCKKDAAENERARTLLASARAAGAPLTAREEAAERRRTRYLSLRQSCRDTGADLVSGKKRRWKNNSRRIPRWRASAHLVMCDLSRLVSLIVASCDCNCRCC